MVVGSGRRDFTDDEFREHVGASDNLAPLLRYHCGIDGLRPYLESQGKFSTVIVFFSLPPKVYADTAAALRAEGLGRIRELSWRSPSGTMLRGPVS